MTTSTSALCYDLHSHSTASDGELSPTALVHRAIERGVHVLALTDHDTVHGLTEAHRANQAHVTPLHLINGVEISTHWHGYDIHIVGLDIDRHHEALLHHSKTARKAWGTRDTYRGKARKSRGLKAHIKVHRPLQRMLKSQGAIMRDGLLARLC